MSYTLYSDKTELFEAKIKLKGASLKKSFCRLVVESDDWNLVFKGEIDEFGHCSIPIKRLRGVLPEGVKGKMKLEVVAEDTYFVPWESDFEVEVAKSVQVEVKQQKSKKLVEKKATAKVIQKPKKNVVAKKKPPKKVINLKEVDNKVHLKEFTKKLIKEGVTYDNISTKTKLIKSIGASLIKEHNLSEKTMKWIIDNTFKLLQKRKDRS